MRSLFSLTVTGLGLAVVFAAPSAAQMSPDATPVSGTLQSAVGDAEVTVRAEAPIPITDCVGFVDPSAPDLAVQWGGGDLRLSVRAPFDATLAVHRPDGTWACDDDTEGTSPVVALADAPAGRYAVWLGAFMADASGTTARVALGPPPPPPAFGTAADAVSGSITASGGFEAEQGAIEVSARAGGLDAADRLFLNTGMNDAPFCTGYLDAARPTAAVAYTADGGTGTLALSASAEEDLVMLVQMPDGTYDCNDDFGGTDPMVVVSDPESGTYLVWAGTFGAIQPVDATLMVMESTPEVFYDDYMGGDFIEPGQPYSEGSYMPLDLTAPAARLDADDEDGETMEATIRPSGANPVQGPSCTGYIEAAPTAGIRLRGDGPFALRASSDGDLTLTVRTPGGQWWCSDDADGLDPGIQIDEVEDGLYLAWVGSFGDVDVPVDVALSAEAGIVESQGGMEGPGGMSQSDGLYDGTEIRAGGASTEVALGDVAVTRSVTAGGTVLNPVEGEVCQGFLSERPTMAVTNALSGIEVSATADDDDLTMVIQAPDGSWTCSDDADGTDPFAVVEGGPGLYSVWIGTFSRRAGTPATVEVAPFE